MEMAWRIDEQVIRGEVDNRERGRVVGRLWLVDRADPLQIDLKGDCWRDLAGRLLEFVNPDPGSKGRDGLVSAQKGVVGDMTASRKVKVPDIPMEEIGEYYAAKKPFPWHWSNSLYLEWVDQNNGRVVVESANYTLNIVGEATWEMTEEEETIQRSENEQELARFMDTLKQAMSEDLGEDNFAGSNPQTEEEADRLLAANDILTDRIQNRLARESENSDFEVIMKEEVARLRQETGDLKLEWIGGDPSLVAGLDDDDEYEIELWEHPLTERTEELIEMLYQLKEQGNWVPKGAIEDHPAMYLVECVSKAGQKFSRALDEHKNEPKIDDCALIIARLKRARVCLDDAILALESCQEQKLIEASSMGVVFVEIIDLAHDADELINDLRTRLKEGS